MVDIVELSKIAFGRLCDMDYERIGGESKERMIFPNKFPSQNKSANITEKELAKYTRISEQELRFLFVEAFITNIASKDYFYSIETPTKAKYKFGKSYEEINPNIAGRSASIDMCIFKRDSNKYERILNVEFKHANSSMKSIGKDILKLVHDEQNGAFIILLDNTDKGTFNHFTGNSGIFDKLLRSLSEHKHLWKGENKFIELVIMSLEQRIFIHHRLTQEDKLKEIFKVKNSGNIGSIVERSWENYAVDKQRTGKTE